MVFEKALERLKAGQNMTRKLWDDNGRGGVVSVVHWGTPNLFITYEDGDIVPWVARDLDIFAGDWEVVK